MSHNENITRIKVVHDALGGLNKEVVFIGGATVSLYIDRPAEEIRPTDDVDVLIELLNYKEYSAIDETLRNKGFVNDTDSGVICRYKIQGVVVDVMPTSDDILGFSNKWYKEAFTHVTEITIGEDYQIKIFDPEYFLSSKIEAFKNRGKKDGRTSSDFEDIIYVLNNRSTIWDELDKASENIRQYLKDEFITMANEPHIYEWISCHLEHNEQRRVPFILGGLNTFIQS